MHQAAASRPPPRNHDQMSAHLHPQFSPSSLRVLSRALDDWSKCGAQFISLPWLASSQSMDATRPAERPAHLDIATPFGSFVASGEQSFLDLAQQGALQSSQLYIGWTPCLRHEEQFDYWHHYQFLKVELFAWAQGWSTGNISETPNPLAYAQLLHLVKTAKELFEQWIGVDTQSHPQVQAVQIDPHSWDLMCNDIELGSYGIRMHPSIGRPYLYGTAVAEPRYSNVVSELV